MDHVNKMCLWDAEKSGLEENLRPPPFYFLFSPKKDVISLTTFSQKVPENETPFSRDRKMEFLSLKVLLDL